MRPCFSLIFQIEIDTFGGSGIDLTSHIARNSQPPPQTAVVSPFVEFVDRVNARRRRRLVEIPPQNERPVAWGTTGLPFEPAWVWDLSKPWGVWEGASMSGLGGPLAGYLGSLVSGAPEMRHPNSHRMPFTYQ